MVETAEEKLARYETVLDLQMKEIDRLRAENARLRSGGDAHTVLKEIYNDPDAPQGNRIKAAQAALNVEKPRLEPVPPPMDLVSEEIIPLADLVRLQRARADRMMLEPPYRVVSGQKPNGNGSNGNGSDDDTAS
jgi:hypothetical protein